MEYYVRLLEGLNTPGQIVPLEDVSDPVKLKSYIRTNPGSDWYTSLFYYPKDIYDLYLEKGSVAGYKGEAYSKDLVWDFDSKESLDKAKEDVRELLRRLAKYTNGPKELVKHCKVYFSGNKGFHVNLKCNRTFTPEQMKIICSNVAEGLATFDSVIYNATRAFRISNTKHQKSGLYKVEVDPFTLAKPEVVEEIKKRAKDVVQEVEVVPLEDMEFVEELLKVKEKKSVVNDDVEEIDGVRGIADLDFSKNKSMPKCVFALANGIFVPGRGERNEILLHLGNFFRNSGHNREVVHNMLKGVVRSNEKLYPEQEEKFTKEEIWNTIIPRVFSDHSKINPGGFGVSKEHPIFARYCKMLPKDCKCKIHDEKQTQQQVISITEVADNFNSFASEFDKNLVRTGIKAIDDNCKICVGTTNLIVGYSGTGKSTLVLNMLENTNKQDQHSMFFCADMNKNIVYLKLATRLTGLSADEVFTAYKTRDKKTIYMIDEVINKHYNKTYFDFSGSPSIDDMVDRIKRTEDKVGHKIKTVVLDYAGRLSGPHVDKNANETYNAIKSKDAADITNSAWIILNQVSRSTGGGGYLPMLDKSSAKGSSEWESSASSLINIWRSFLGIDGITDPESGVTFYDQFMNIYIAKTRLDKEKQEVLLWHGERGLVRDLTSEERDRYELDERPKEKLGIKYRKMHRV